MFEDIIELVDLNCIVMCVNPAFEIEIVADSKLGTQDEIIFLKQYQEY